CSAWWRRSRERACGGPALFATGSPLFPVEQCGDARGRGGVFESLRQSLSGTRGEQHLDVVDRLGTGVPNPISDDRAHAGTASSSKRSAASTPSATASRSARPGGTG